MTAVRLKVNKIVMKSKVKMCLFSVLRNRHISQPSYSVSPRLSNCSILSPNLSPRLAFQQTQYRTDEKKAQIQKISTFFSRIPPTALAAESFWRSKIYLPTEKKGKRKKESDLEMEAQEKNKHKHVLEENLVGIGDTLHFDL
jgi:hypothetical protein